MLLRWFAAGACTKINRDGSKPVVLMNSHPNCCIVTNAFDFFRLRNLIPEANS